MRRIFRDYAAGYSTREIARRLDLDQVPSPAGNAVWGTSTIGRLLRPEAHTGRAYYNRKEVVPDQRMRGRTRRVLRQREQRNSIDVPRIVSDASVRRYQAGLTIPC